MSIEIIIPKVIPDRPSDAAASVRAASSFSGSEIVRATVTPSGAGLTRTLTIQVVNQKLQECRGLFMLALVIGTTDAGAPAGVQTIAAPSAGVLVASLVANQAAIYLTDSSGALVVNVTQIGAWVARYPRVVVLGAAQGTDPVT